jgi:drug/metabolite transporter (DMT)-like permease
VSGAPAALLASLLWGFADFLAGRASRRIPAVLVAFVGQAVGLVVLAIILLFHGFNAKAFPAGAASGAFGVIGILSFYRALGLGTMSIVAPVVATCAVVPVAAGVVIDGERPATLQWIGVIAALDPAAEHDSLSGVFAARMVAVPVLAGLTLRAHARAPLAMLPQLGGVGLLDTGANTMFAIATTGGLLSLVAVLGGLFPVVTVALAYFLLHERLQPTQRAGVLLALAGIPLISA